jgi:hypothetical protein
MGGAILPRISVAWRLNIGTTFSYFDFTAYEARHLKSQLRIGVGTSLEL